MDISLNQGHAHLLKRESALRNRKVEQHFEVPQRSPYLEQPSHSKHENVILRTARGCHGHWKWFDRSDGQG